MRKESKFFIINYTDSDKDYIDKLLIDIDTEALKIMKFFGIDEIKDKFEVNLIPTKKEFSKLSLELCNFKDDEYGIGFVKDRIMYCLSFKDYKSTYYSFYKYEDFVKTITHEFVHSCHQLKTNNKSSIRCINEGLACYLSKQYNREIHELEASLDDFVNDKYINYDNYYLLVEFIFNNYDNDYISELIYNKEFARNEIEKIYNDYKKSHRR